MFINATKKSLLRLPRFIKRSVVIFYDLLLCGLTSWLAFGVRLDQWGLLRGNQWLVFIVAIGFSFPLFTYFGLYRAIFRYIGSTAFLSIIKVFILYTSVIFCIFTLFGVNDVPRSIGIIQPILLFIGIGVGRYFIRYWFGRINNVQSTFPRVRPIVLIYGAGSAGRQLAIGLSSSHEMLVKGFIDDNPHLHGSSINGVNVFSFAMLQDVVSKLKITDILLCIPSASQSLRREIIASLSLYGIRVRSVPGLADITAGLVRLSDLHDLNMNDLLGREVVPPKLELLEKNIRDKVVLVTGAGGSIGSELCRQIIKLSPKLLILLDNSEHHLYQIYEELKTALNRLEDNRLTGAGDDQTSLLRADLLLRILPYLASVRDGDLLLKIFREHQPFIVFHAAAYKHVPLVEQNAIEGIRNNVFGTFTCAQVSLECGVSQFILVSTDKAVRPTNIMGASKRIAEQVLQAMEDNARKEDHSTNFSMVRFGNVLGSSGSVVPHFSAQIAVGGPITLTHKEVTRYFMTIPEAAQLVIQASAMAVGGDVFVLDMSKPIRIYDLAVKMIYLSGLLVKDDIHPYGDIEIKVIGLRKGEKLYEELLIGDNPQPTSHPKIIKAHEQFLSWNDLQQELEKLKLALDSGDGKLIRSMLKKLVPGYQPNGALD